MRNRLLTAFFSLGAAVGSQLAQADDLVDIYRLAQQKDPQILQAKANRDAAFEAINEQRATLLPQLNLGASWDYTKTNKDDLNTNNTLGASVGLSQAIYRQSNWLNLSQAEKVASQSDVFYALQQQDLILRTTNAYFAVLSAQDNLDFVRANKRAVERQLEQTKQRFEVGLTAITDVHEAQAEFDRVVADEIAAENTLSNSYEALRELTGVEHRQLSVLNTERFSASGVGKQVDPWFNTAIDKNLSLHIARIGKEIAQTNIELAQSGHLPTLDLRAGIGASNTDYDNENLHPDTGTLSSGNIGLQFNLPLYTGGAITSQVKQAQHAYVVASEDLESTYRGVQTSVRSSFNNINASIGSIRAFQQTVVSAESALKATEAGFEVGTRTIVDVLDATRNLYSAKQQLSTARYLYILNHLNLLQAAGTLSDTDVETINEGLQPAELAPAVE